MALTEGSVVETVKIDRPKNPEARGGFIRRRIREDEVDRYLDNGWALVQNKDGDRFKAQIGDICGNAGQPGRLFLVEIPSEKYQRFANEFMGGSLTQKQNEALKGKNNYDKENVGGERIEPADGLPPQARIKR